MSTSRTSGRNVILIIIQEHRTVEQLHAQLMQSPPTEALMIALMMIREICIHAHKEQAILYPLFDRLPDGPQQAQHAIHEHQQVESQCALLEQECVRLQAHRDDAAVSALIVKVNDLMTALTHHVHEEETDLLIKLQAVMTEEESISLGRQWESLNAKIASRPHLDFPPMGQEHLAANAAVAAMDALADEGRFKHSAALSPGFGTDRMSDVQLKEPTAQEQYYASSDAEKLRQQQETLGTAQTKMEF